MSNKSMVATVKIDPEMYERLAAEARKEGVTPDALASQWLNAVIFDLTGNEPGEWE